MARPTTKRLLLSPKQAADLDELWPIFQDPAGWVHDPGSRHLATETTTSFISRAEARWASDGLSYWTVRQRGTGAVTGRGGVQRHRTGSWNLAYRLGAEHWAVATPPRSGWRPSRRRTRTTMPCR